MANIVLTTLVFSPDGVSTSILMTDLAMELREMGHNLTVLTTTPHYNWDEDARKDQPLRPRWGTYLLESDCRGIPVLHAKVPSKSSRVMARLLDYARFHLVSTAAGLLLVKKVEIILAPSPPLTIGLSAWVLSVARRVPFIYNVQEIYPDIAVKLGVLRNKRLIRLLEKLERFIYARARKVVVISRSFREKLIARGVPEEKIVVIPNFTDTEFMRPGVRNSEFSRTHGLGKKFVVLYAGNIGLTQSFDTVLSAADHLHHLPEIIFLIVGDGALRNVLEERLNLEKPLNVRLLPYQPGSVVPSMYAASDICLVPLKKGAGRETFPSKIYTIMAAGRPSIVAADSNSELARVTVESECGWVIPPDDDRALSRAVEHAYRQRSELGQKSLSGRRYVEKYHSRRIVAGQYDRLIKEMIVKERA